MKVLQSLAEDSAGDALPTVLPKYPCKNERPNRTLSVQIVAVSPLVFLPCTAPEMVSPFQDSKGNDPIAPVIEKHMKGSFVGQFVLVIKAGIVTHFTIGQLSDLPRTDSLSVGRKWSNSRDSIAARAPHQPVGLEWSSGNTIEHFVMVRPVEAAVLSVLSDVGHATLWTPDVAHLSTSNLQNQLA